MVNHNSRFYPWLIGAVLLILLLFGVVTAAPGQINLPIIVGSGDKTASQRPFATDDAYQTAIETAVHVDATSGVLLNDTSPDQQTMHAELQRDTRHGQLTLKASGAFDYLPDAGFSGQDTFTYRVSDGMLASTTATVHIAVGVANSPPQIVSGEMAFAKQVIDQGFGRTRFVLAADLDADTDLDLVGTSGDNGRVFWYENDGSGSFTRRLVGERLHGAYPISLADLDGDNAIDILAGGYLNATFAWYKNDGTGSFTKHEIDTATPGPHSILAYDLDKDGDKDLVTSSQDAGVIAWYENDGSNNFTLRLIDSGADTAKRADAVDLNGDGELDIITASWGIDEIAWQENDGSEHFTKHVISTSANGAYFVSYADIDGDNDPDLFSASQLDGKIAWYKNNGSGSFTTKLITSSALGARSVRPFDINRDGIVDALTSSHDDDTIAWYENDGAGNFTKHVIDDDADGAYGAYAVDMDFDGDMDVLSSAIVADEIAVHTQFRAHSASVPKGGLLLLGSGLLLTIDADNSAAELTYALTGAPQVGHLRLSGANLAQGDTFTQEDINQNRLTYRHTGATLAPDQFTFAVADSGAGGVQPATGTFDLQIAEPTGEVP